MGGHFLLFGKKKEKTLCSQVSGFTDDSGSEQWAIEMHCHYPSLNVKGWGRQEIQGLNL